MENIKKDHENDTRVACKYGSGCYQKNPDHQAKFKHPPKRANEEEDLSTNVKRAKLDESNSSNQENSKEKKDVASSVDHKRAFIKSKFLVDMPEDFYAFWDLCKKINAKDTLNAFKLVGLRLVGPYDVLANKFLNKPEKTPEEYLLHWRYYYDPPEFQTVIKGDDATGYHLGYFRDTPQELPAFVASNHRMKDGVITPVGDNLFAAVSLYLEELKSKADPFKKMQISNLQNHIKTTAKELSLPLSSKTNKMREREKKIVSKTFNKAGLVVPIQPKTGVGYRELTMSDEDLNKLFQRLLVALPEQKNSFMTQLQPVLTNAILATDECDFGTGIELGWNIIFSGVESLNDTALRYLSISYKLLNREEFATIAEAHLKNRKKGCNLSIL